MGHDPDRPGPAQDDALTIVSVAIVAYILGAVLHEGVGHGGACLLTGGTPVMVSTVEMQCSAYNRLVTAGGTMMNVAAGALFFALGRVTGRTSPRFKYFFWLSMTVNLFAAAGYFLFSGIGGFGDWAVFVQGFSPPWAWRVGMTIFGAAAYMVTALLSLMELRPVIGSGKEGRIKRAARLSRTPYFTGGILACVAGSLNPQGWILVVLSAAASTFGGSSGLVWMTEWLKGERIPLGPTAAPMTIGRSWAWIMIACILAVAFVALLGPGLRFAQRT